ncbi:aminotransferase class V-fold PLP-dependent enzyme [Erwinia sp. CPCC 100877]|nr:aminotransferase class V-fold PLP-dependent enzyme [Erwinia sp. CPCC 100877]
MKQPIYLNHAATSNQKFPATVVALTDYLTMNNNLNLNRGTHDLAQLKLIFEVRQTIAHFFQAPDPAHIIFTANATMSLNMILNGLLKPGDHVLTSSLEHNAVVRPLTLLEKQGVEVTYLDCEANGCLRPEQITLAVKPQTKALILTHASNVLGTILPVKECFQQAKQHGLITILDSAQTAGFLPINMQELGVDVLAFTGHKGLMGLAGIGGFALADHLETMIDPWLTGGTGSQSHSLQQPACLPDKFEAGTMNSLGILSLKTSIEQIENIGLATIMQHERRLTDRFLTGLKALPVRILGTQEAQQSVPVVSIVSDKIGCGELAQLLFDRYQIVTRSGLHCAPLAHQTAGTLEKGAVRFSFGWFTTPEEVDYTLQALQEIFTTLV